MKICQDKINCFGCGACQAICPQNAITMLPDEEGFRYPIIDMSKCIDCGLCYKVCCSNNKTEFKFQKVKIYGLKINNYEDRMKSSSGGAFVAFARHVIELGGVVSGAVFDKDLFVVHSMVDDNLGVEKCRGSKYVQSNIEKIYYSVEEMLKQQRIVLFTGTPCQCDSVLQYCKVKKLNTKLLYLCDLICHGVSSPKIWKEYCSLIQTKNKIISYNFRDKNVNWHGSNIRALYSNGKICINTPILKIFSNLYFSSLISRPSCSRCKYANFNRRTDITIGDFWGCEKSEPIFSDKYGVSLVILHTQKAINMFNSIKDNFDSIETNQKSCEQEQLRQPVVFSKRREQFWHDYNEKGFLFVSRKYADFNFSGQVMRTAKNIIKKILH